MKANLFRWQFAQFAKTVLLMRFHAVQGVVGLIHTKIHVLLIFLFLRKQRTESDAQRLLSFKSIPKILFLRGKK